MMEDPSCRELGWRGHWSHLVDGVEQRRALLEAFPVRMSADSTKLRQFDLLSVGSGISDRIERRAEDPAADAG